MRQHSTKVESSGYEELENNLFKNNKTILFKIEDSFFLIIDASITKEIQS